MPLGGGIHRISSSAREQYWPRAAFLLLKWLLAIYMLTSARKGIPGTQMARELGVTQKTVWFLAQRIRETWMGSNNDKMDGQVQVDETYVGGKEKNKHADKKLKAGRGAVGKVAVVGKRWLRKFEHLG